MRGQGPLIAQPERRVAAIVPESSCHDNYSRRVAQAAGVSQGTAARVLSSPELVAEATRHRVLKVIQELGYSRNSVAASPHTTRTGQIIVTVPNISNPFFSRVIRGVEEAAQKAGYAIPARRSAIAISGGAISAER